MIQKPEILESENQEEEKGPKLFTHTIDQLAGGKLEFVPFMSPELNIPAWATMVNDTWGTKVKDQLLDYYKNHQLLLKDRQLFNSSNFYVTMDIGVFNRDKLTNEADSFRDYIRSMISTVLNIKPITPEQFYIGFFMEKDYFISALINFKENEIIIQCSFVSELKSAGGILLK